MVFTLLNFIGFGITVLITLIISIYLIKRYLKSKEITIGYFASFITARFSLFLFFALSILIYLVFRNSLISSILFLIGWIIVFISLVFPPLLFCSLKWPEMKKIYPGIIGGLGILGIILALIEFTPVTIDPNTGLAFISTPKFSGMIYMFCKFFGVLPLAILFLSRIKKEKGWLKIRSLLIGLGLFVIVSTIFVPSLLGGIWAGIYSGIGDILIFAGVIYRAPNQFKGE
jgi:hypothetical protein